MKDEASVAPCERAQVVSLRGGENAIAVQEPNHTQTRSRCNRSHFGVACTAMAWELGQELERGQALGLAQGLACAQDALEEGKVGEANN